MKLLFMDRKDIFNTWGQIRFGATSLEKIADTEHPDPPSTAQSNRSFSRHITGDLPDNQEFWSDNDFTVRCCLPRDDGGWTVYACDGGRNNMPWRIYRFRTEDGIHLLDTEKVYQSEEGRWSQTTTLTYSPEKEMFLCLKNVKEEDGGSIYAFWSHDGTNWREYENNPVYYEGDRWGVVWSSAVQRFITYNKGIQPYDGKRVPELALDARRVVTVRTSADGFHWEPDDPDWSRRGAEFVGGMMRMGGPFVPVEYQIMPDELDPPDMEFYAGQAFEYEERYYMMMMNYAGCFLPPGTPPVTPTGHGPVLDTEWWISRDGLNWDRPFRDIHASGESTHFIEQSPIICDGKLLFHQRARSVWGIPEDRITYVTSRANGIFETLLFAMPQTRLKLNAKIPGDGYPEGEIQAYVMVELIDDCNRVIPGYEKEKCLLRPSQDSLAIELEWDSKDGRGLAGQKVRLRFYMRASQLYAVTA